MPTKSQQRACFLADLRDPVTRGVFADFLADDGYPDWLTDLFRVHDVDAIRARVAALRGTGPLSELSRGTRYHLSWLRRLLDALDALDAR